MKKVFFILITLGFCLIIAFLLTDTTLSWNSTYDDINLEDFRDAKTGNIRLPAVAVTTKSYGILMRRYPNFKWVVYAQSQIF